MNNNEPCRTAFTRTLLELAKNDPSIYAVSTDARGSVTLNEFVDELPEQYVECGIAEQNAVGIGAGLAMCGKKVFVCAPACFMSARALEQIKVDVAYANTNVKIFGVSGGVSYGALGTTHHSLHDIAVMRAIHNMAVIIPSDRHLTEAMTRVLPELDVPAYIRVGRAAVKDVYKQNSAEFVFGKANMLHQGSDLTIIATGEMVSKACEANEILKANNISVRVLDMHTIKPIDENAVILAARDTGRIVSIEEHSIFGGLGEAIAHITSQKHPVPMKILGLPDEAIVSGDSQEVFEHYGLTGGKIASQIIAWMGESD